ncbi:MAG TPA: xanthine dehydrogenase family protein molybdopterin-binding subunit [Candidatus Binatia bacterium]|nr:xanthine dehydrogenase family protein molybdopterin-binding subunit [Candidatus Binatia bacterium]
MVGRAVPRVDGVEKVTGKALYTIDIDLPGMAHGKILRSPFAHARLIKIDASKAEKIPGVITVLTRDDLTGLNPYFGAAYKDQPIVAVDKVRYAGDPVAAVVAENEAASQEGISLIDVEYEELPAVTSLDEALAPGAPLVHETQSAGGEMYGHPYEAPKEFSGTNLCYQFHYAKGDVAKGFKKSDYIFENTFTFARVQHYSMEPHVTVASFERDRLTLWAATQEPFALREHLAEIFDLPLSKVRIIVPYVGGGYGGKLAVKIEPLVAALSWKSRRPVKVTLTVEESFKTVTRHPARFRIKTGVSRDGCLIARECQIHMDTGAYADAGPRVTQKAGYRAPGPYRIPHIKTSAYTVYTNTVPAGAFRGFGTLQVTWAYESQMDIIAEKLGMGALEFRLKNLLKKGEDYTPGDTPVDCDLSEGLLRAARAIGWKQKKNSNRGKGLSCCMKDGGGTYKVSAAAVKMNSDGSVVLFTGTVELGQGARTALSQVIAEELGLSLQQVSVAQLDTDATPYDSATNASSSMVIMGLCVQRAARDLKGQLLRRASKVLKAGADRLSLKNGKIYEPGGRSISFEKLMKECFGAKGGDIVGRGTYQDRKSPKAVLGSPTTFWETSWGGAEIEVDRDTGEVNLLKYVSIADVGKAIHPVQCKSQDEGAVMFAIGHTLLEEMIYQNGHLLNPNLIDYRVPTLRNVPNEFRTMLLENHNGPGPFGSKGMGEGGLLPVASAIGNALYNAVGVRIYDLPLTPEKVWREISKAGGVRRKGKSPNP